MDVPNTGAIFTLGKSYLAENTQSYFYIKNDPIKRLISGPHQSAVICESGRLFAWGENHYGQLGIGTGVNKTNGSSNNNNDNNNSNINDAKHSDIVTKPTCVKSLKTLGLKIADIAYGNNWAVILAHSNELFFCGRNIFANESKVSRNFIATTISNETCAIIRKPFRLEEFDDCLSNSEEAENFITVLSGNEHFAVMTSFGRLIGWGSNSSHQLGAYNGNGNDNDNDNDNGNGNITDNNSDDSLDDIIKEPLKPFEIVLDSPVRQFACGPESTLVLTESGNLFITGRLNDLVFTEFVILQKNLSSAEKIIFMHISKASEIFIVTNAGSIFRSTESVRNKSLIFQRFYDYDSEENGPIWKMLKGSSFYAVLTKANKFYTTFSESGHHLKTFREISKFKNLRLLDMAVGDQHILVHGIPRSSTLSATVGPSGEHRFMSRTFVMPPTQQINGDGMANSDSDDKEKEKETTKEQQHEHETDNNRSNGSATKKAERTSGDAPSDTALEGMSKIEENGNNRPTPKLQNDDNDGYKNNLKHLNGSRDMEENTNEKQTKISTIQSESPTESMRSQKSIHSIKFDSSAIEKNTSNEKLLRPRTPYPESSTGSTPQTAIKKTPLRNYSYEAAMDNDYLEQTSPPPPLGEGLEEIPESITLDKVAASAPIADRMSASTLPVEEDEHLAVEINTTADALDNTVVVNEIRFINNGVDVTANVKENMMESESDSNATEDDTEGTVKNVFQKVVDDVKENTTEVRDLTEGMLHNLEENITEKFDQAAELKNDAQEGIGNAIDVISTKAKDAKDAISEGMLDKFKQGIAEKVDQAAELKNDAEEGIGNAIDVVSTKAKDAKDVISEGMLDKFKQGIAEKVDQAAELKNDAQEGIASAIDVVSTKAKDAKEAIETTSKNVAREAIDTVGENAKRVADGAWQAVDNAGQGALEVAGNARHAVDNAFTKVASEAKQAVGAVTTKISNEMHDAKDNLTALLQPKATATPTRRQSREDELDDEPLSSKDNGIDDERTTASVNSNHTSSAGGGNPFETAGNPFENDVENSLERGKQVLRNEINNIGHREVERGKGRLRKFFDDLKSTSCRNEKSVQIYDEPPRYTVSDELNSGPNRNDNGGQNNNNTSTVCTIL